MAQGLLRNMRESQSRSNNLHHVTVMSYNIEQGGKNTDGTSRLERIKKVIRRGLFGQRNPDVVGLQETNDFGSNRNRTLKEMSSELSYPHVAIAEPRELGRRYSVSTLSQLPFVGPSRRLEGFKNAGLITTVDMGGRVGEVQVANVHLSPFQEDARVKEVKRLIATLHSGKHAIVMGDLNSLSPRDGYPSSLPSEMNDKQKEKFTNPQGRLQHQTIQMLLDAGFIDLAEYFCQQKVSTVPTLRRRDRAHRLPLRIDYILVSPSLLPFVQAYGVVKDAVSEGASDHYPVVAKIVT